MEISRQNQMPLRLPALVAFVYPALVIVVLAQLSVVCWSREKGHLSPLFLLVAVIGKPVRLLFLKVLLSVVYL